MSKHDNCNAKPRSLPNFNSSAVSRKVRALKSEIQIGWLEASRHGAALGRRLLDSGAGLLGLVLLAPLIGVRALIAYIDAGKIFEAQPRVGRGGTTFHLLRFAGNAPGRNFGILFNLLRGDIAVAGPRLREPGEQPDTTGAELATRLSAKPGLVSPYMLRQRVGIAHETESNIDSEFVYTGTVTGDMSLLVRSGLGRAMVGSNDRPTPPRLEFFKISMSNTTMAEAVAWMLDRCRAREVTQVAFVNPDCLNISVRDPAYATVLKNAQLVLPDGIGIKVGCRLQGIAMRDNLNGTDLFPKLCESAAQHGLSLYLLGARPGMAEATALTMQARFPNLKIAGTHHGYIDPADEHEMIETINAAKPDIVLVAMGAPRQEMFLARWQGQLQAPLRMGVGGLFDYYSGSIPRAPIWMREIGLEWVWRLIQEPGRMWKRYVIGNPLFIFRVWRESAGRKDAMARLPRGLLAVLPIRAITTVVASLRRTGWQLYIHTARLAKRVLDIAVSGVLLVLLAPLFAVVAGAIRLESPGPVFFKQIRVGQWGRTFPMWKFRSMQLAAEAQQRALASQNQMSGGVIFKMKRDPRITRVGQVIRRLSIDELPQLWNVFRGDMSLVGPRPSLPAEVDMYTLADRGRLDAKPGITCIWQVSGRSEIPFAQQVALDIEYIQTQSVKNDVSLLVKTVPAVLSGRGAY